MNLRNFLKTSITAASATSLAGHAGIMLHSWVSSEPEPGKWVINPKWIESIPKKRDYTKMVRMPDGPGYPELQELDYDYVAKVLPVMQKAEKEGKCYLSTDRMILDKSNFAPTIVLNMIPAPHLPKKKAIANLVRIKQKIRDQNPNWPDEILSQFFDRAIDSHIAELNA